MAKFLNEVTTEESIGGLLEQSEREEATVEPNKENWDAKSSAGSVMSIGQQSTTSHATCTTEMLGITQDTKFILLDLREEEDYKKWHIRDSISFPAPNITRDKTFA